MPRVEQVSAFYASMGRTLDAENIIMRQQGTISFNLGNYAVAVPLGIISVGLCELGIGDGDRPLALVGAQSRGIGHLVLTLYGNAVDGKVFESGGSRISGDDQAAAIDDLDLSGAQMVIALATASKINGNLNREGVGEIEAGSGNGNAAGK